MSILTCAFCALRHFSACLVALRMSPGLSLAPLVIMLLAPVFAAAQPNIQSINPLQGPIAGGTSVTLSGSGFAGTTLTLDGAVIAPSSASDSEIVFQTPARNNGIASIKLSGNGPNAYAEFLYLPPALNSLPPGYITTVMGIGIFRGDGRPATSVMVDAAEPGFAVASDGSLFFSEHNKNVIRRLRPDGIVERYAGTGGFGNSGDGGPALDALFFEGRGLAIDAAGNLLFGMTSIDYNAIRRIDASTGIITTLYGGSGAGFSGDGGPAVNAQFNAPAQIGFDAQRNLYVLDLGNARVRKIDTSGTISTIAGSGAVGFSGDGGPATQASFNLGWADLSGMAVDTQGNVYVADTLNNRVRRIDAATGIITTFAGKDGASYLADVGAVVAVLTDRDDNVYVGVNILSGSTTPRLLKLSPAGQFIQSWGKGFGLAEDGADAATAPMCQLTRLVLDLSGNIIYTDQCSNRLRRVNIATGRIETIAGMGAQIIGDTGPAVATVLNSEGADLLFLPSGELLTAEGSNYRIRKMDQSGNLSNFAGTGLLLSFPDGAPALQTSMSPLGLGRTPNGDILITGYEGITRIDSAGILHKVTDTHKYGYSGDGGPASAAVTDQPFDVGADSSGNIFIADTNNNRLRRIDAQTGAIDTVAGSGPVNGQEAYGKYNNSNFPSGDGGLATQAWLNTPYGIAIAPDGTMYIGENGQRIRKVAPNGIISTFFSGGGQRVRLSLAGNLFMPPYRIQPNGHAYRFTQLGSQSQASLGDGGPASLANFGGGVQDTGVAVDSEGNLFFADTFNRRIRAVRYGAVMAEPGSTVAASGGTAQTSPPATAFSAPLQITLTSPEGTPENGIRVDFATPSTGASCTFTGGSSTFSTLTDIDGHASAVCTANAQPGSYSVTATPLALAQSASFSLTNLNAVTISGSGMGSVRIDTTGASCGRSCSAGFVTGASVTLSAVPAAGESFLGWSGACSGTEPTCTFTVDASTSVGAAFTGTVLNLVPGWNLIGNSSSGVLDVAAALGDAAKVSTIWKWIANSAKWAFYAPSLIGPALTDYAASKSYDVLTSVTGGEGFWVNAKLAGSVDLPSGSAIGVAALGPKLISGWNLVSVGETATPKQFCDAQNGGITTLWAWDATQSAWYFHAPSLDTSGGLASYITSKGYLGFTTANKTLGPGVGFWVNKP